MFLLFKIGFSINTNLQETGRLINTAMYSLNEENNFDLNEHNNFKSDDDNCFSANEESISDFNKNKCLCSKEKSNFNLKEQSDSKYIHECLLFNKQDNYTIEVDKVDQNIERDCNKQFLKFIKLDKEKQPVNENQDFDCFNISNFKELNINQIENNFKQKLAQNSDFNEFKPTTNDNQKNKFLESSQMKKSDEIKIISDKLIECSNIKIDKGMNNSNMQMKFSNKLIKENEVCSQKINNSKIFIQKDANTLENQTTQTQLSIQNCTNHKKLPLTQNLLNGQYKNFNMINDQNKNYIQSNLNTNQQDFKSKISNDICDDLITAQKFSSFKLNNNILSLEKNIYTNLSKINSPLKFDLTPPYFIKKPISTKSKIITEEIQTKVTSIIKRLKRQSEISDSFRLINPLQVKYICQGCTNCDYKCLLSKYDVQIDSTSTGINMTNKHFNQTEIQSHDTVNEQNNLNSTKSIDLNEFNDFDIINNSIKSKQFENLDNFDDLYDLDKLKIMNRFKTKSNLNSAQPFINNLNNIILCNFTKNSNLHKSNASIPSDILSNDNFSVNSTNDALKSTCLINQANPITDEKNNILNAPITNLDTHNVISNTTKSSQNTHNNTFKSSKDNSVTTNTHTIYKPTPLRPKKFKYFARFTDKPKIDPSFSTRLNLTRQINYYIQVIQHKRKKHKRRVEFSQHISLSQFSSFKLAYTHLLKFLTSLVAITCNIRPINLNSSEYTVNYLKTKFNEISDIDCITKSKNVLECFKNDINEILPLYCNNELFSALHGFYLSILGFVKICDNCEKLLSKLQYLMTSM